MIDMKVMPLITFKVTINTPAKRLLNKIFINNNVLVYSCELTSCMLAIFVKIHQRLTYSEKPIPNCSYNRCHRPPLSHD